MGREGDHISVAEVIDPENDIEVFDLEDVDHLLPTLKKSLCITNPKKHVTDLSSEDEDNDQVLEINPTDLKVRWSETILSEKPKASMIHNFLSKEECEHLINLGKPYLRRSLVGEYQGNVSSSRTSYGAFLDRGADNIVTDIEKRISEYTNVPIENGEGLQILHYEVGQKFEPHFDYSDDASYIKTHGIRMATVLMYLSDVEEGGETVFPLAEGLITSGNSGYKKGLSVKPKLGDALVFWSMKPDGTRDPFSFHGGSPVIRGDKWSCTKWLHSTKYLGY